MGSGGPGRRTLACHGAQPVRWTIRRRRPEPPRHRLQENRQIHIPDLDNLDPSIANWPGAAARARGRIRTICGTPLRREDKAIGA